MDSFKAGDPGGLLRELELYACIIGRYRRGRWENLLLLPIL